jgi:hypothetical protein
VFSVQETLGIGLGLAIGIGIGLGLGLEYFPPFRVSRRLMNDRDFTYEPFPQPLLVISRTDLWQPWSRSTGTSRHSIIKAYSVDEINPLCFRKPNVELKAAARYERRDKVDLEVLNIGRSTKKSPSAPGRSRLESHRRKE